MSSTPGTRVHGRSGAALTRSTVFRAPASGASRSAPRRRRSLVAYLLVPRPKDLSKALLLPTTFGIGALAAGGVDASTVLRAVVVLAAVELLIYAARYQWNDIGGFVADQRILRRRTGAVFRVRSSTGGVTFCSAAPAR